MPFADYKDFADCVAKNQDKENPEAYCGSIKHKVEDSKSEGTLELKDPRGDGAVLDDRGQPNIIDYSNQEPLLYGLGDNSSHEYPGKIVITNESRYVDREVKRSNIPNVAETGKHATGADKTQPTLPTGAPYELQKPSHNLHGLNFNDSVDWSKQEVISIGSGLVARQIGGLTKKEKEEKSPDNPRNHKFLAEGPPGSSDHDECQTCGEPKKNHNLSEGGPGSGRLAKLAGKISAHAPLVTSQLVNLATQIPLEGVDENDRKEMVEAIMKNEVQQLLREAQFVEEQHPRDDDGKFTSGGGTTQSEKKKPHPPTVGYFPEPIVTSSIPETAHIETADKVLKNFPELTKDFLVQQSWKADNIREAHTKNIEKTANDLQSLFPDADIQFRVKSRMSMLEKLGRKKHYKNVSDLKDVSASRIVIDSNERVLEVATQIKKKYNVIKEENFITKPLPSGYRSYHFDIKNPDGTISELQVRTPNQDKWSNWAHDFIYHPGTPKIKSMIERNIDLVNNYAQDLSNYYETLDRGEKANKPNCPPEIDDLEGCFKF